MLPNSDGQKRDEAEGEDICEEEAARRDFDPGHRVSPTGVKKSVGVGCVQYPKRAEVINEIERNANDIECAVSVYARESRRQPPGRRSWPRRPIEIKIP